MIKNTTLSKVWNAAWPWLLVTLIWQICFSIKLINSAFLSSPSEIVLSFLNLNFWQILVLDLFSTFSRLILGLISAYIFTLIIVYLSLYFPKFLIFIQSINNVWKYLPAPVIIPLSILAFGLTDFAKISVVTFTVFVLYLSHSLSILNKDYVQYETLMNSWKLSPNQRFWNIFLPQNNFLSYRVLPQIVLWGAGTAILTELILGGQTGLGLRLLLFQQLYKTGYLYAYLVVILMISFGLEKMLLNIFSRYKWDLQKLVSSLLILVMSVFALSFQLPKVLSDIQSPNTIKIVSYNGVINLPLLVNQKKFNSLNAQIEFVGSGLQAMDALQAGKSTIAGYSDMPNVLQAVQSNSRLGIVGQLTETQTNPALFLIAKNKLSSNNLSNLNGGKIAYFPNNPIIKQGLDFVLFTKGVNTASVDYTSGNDPSSLVQSMLAGKIDAMVSFEPYIADIESKLNTERVNSDKTLIGSISFSHLPLAGLVVDIDKLKGESRNRFLDDMNKSLEFIRQNTSAENLAIGELKTILDENNLNLNSHIPEWQTSSEVKTEDLAQLVAILKTYAVEGFDNIDSKKLDGYYLR